MADEEGSAFQVELTFGDLKLGPSSIGAPEYIGDGAYSVSYVATKVRQTPVKIVLAISNGNITNGRRPHDKSPNIARETNTIAHTVHKMLLLPSLSCFRPSLCDGYVGRQLHAVRQDSCWGTHLLRPTPRGGVLSVRGGCSTAVDVQ